MHTYWNQSMQYGVYINIYICICIGICIYNPKGCHLVRICVARSIQRTLSGNRMFEVACYTAIYTKCTHIHRLLRWYIVNLGYYVYYGKG